MAITEDPDLEVLALSQNKQFWKIIDVGPPGRRVPYW
jgi:hypothetical protein